MIKQRGSCEETLITLTRVMPTISVVPTPTMKQGSMSSIDQCGSNDLQVSPEALEAKRVEKLVRNLRRQASATCEEEAR